MKLKKIVALSLIGAFMLTACGGSKGSTETKSSNSGNKSSSGTSAKTSTASGETTGGTLKIWTYLSGNEQKVFEGHTTLYPGGKECRCGKCGCFEQYCSKQALLKEYSLIKGEKEPTLSMLKKDYIGGDLEVKELVENYKNNLIIGLGNIVTLFSPEILILKSDIFIEFPDIFEEVKNSLKQYNKNVQVSLTRWKEYSTLFGAIILVLQNYFDIPSFNSYLPGN